MRGNYLSRIGREDLTLTSILKGDPILPYSTLDGRKRTRVLDIVNIDSVHKGMILYPGNQG